jgi:hypothetical protein
MKRVDVLLLMLIGSVACSNPQNHLKEARADDLRLARLADNEVSVPWKLASVGHNAITIDVPESGCFSFKRVHVDESKPREVLVEAIERVGSSTSCYQYLVTRRQSVPLTKDLGSRVLVRAPISSRWNGPTTLESTR